MKRPYKSFIISREFLDALKDMGKNGYNYAETKKNLNEAAEKSLKILYSEDDVEI